VHATTINITGSTSTISACFTNTASESEAPLPIGIATVTT
jgi:hypothetical protein